ncbi:MAG: thioredoxin domain-containing protein [Methanocalculus sp. MSAO_Arc1]|uniref:thioredoxin domain-containing protein n=1 Tax=Methanocalculus TaxID=71151 RepID=UPI000FF7C9F5|nr:MULTISPECIES: thioredoxin domain-containing protein [unclassified Methanocalculus]MCP1661713.1 uncharacterized protein YyaL (SSP411 family) [Methanocalculus sp. AMF5]RQD80771.1 MAG: thioredoxin domain-containing protein [Methanocalculus sp. MSAO_Arc1]
MSNRLADELSPYLRQHADNPVDWHPFSEEAFQKAKEEDILVFLSIGYSTCHWCHVMNRESFSDAGVAAALRDRFVAVKVDREERPDVDRFAMTACQLMTGSGGWPLTLVLTPDKRPLFAGTYFPRDPVAGRPGLFQVLDRIWEFWRTNRGEAEEIALRVEEAVQQYLSGQLMQPEGSHPTDTEDFTDAAYSALADTYDRQYAGFGTGMKFPTPQALLFLLRYGGVKAKRSATVMALQTLHAMRSGGINDQIGGGFHRYATDRQWMIPHYEKMATDQALLLTAFAEGYRISGDLRLRDEAERIAGYMKRDLLSPEGLFYTAEDAESGGEEGGFYLWSKKELISLLGEEDGAWAAGVLLPDQKADTRSPPALRSDPADQGRLHLLREKLLLLRNQRPRPFRDEKILLDVNGMAIASLARSGLLLGDPEMIRLAESAFATILELVKRDDRGFFHSMIDGTITSDALLPDYAELIHAAIQLHQATWNTEYLLSAKEWLDLVIARFYHEDEGWFWFEQAGGSLFRTRDLEDAAGPSANAVMLHNLLLLSRISGDQRYSEIGSRMLETMQPAFSRHPAAYLHSISAFYHLSFAALDVVITGDQHYYRDAFTATRNLLLTYLHLSQDAHEIIRRLIPKAEAYMQDMQENNAYVCRQAACLPTPADARELLLVLNEPIAQYQPAGTEPLL